MSETASIGNPDETEGVESRKDDFQAVAGADGGENLVRERIDGVCRIEPRRKSKGDGDVLRGRHAESAEDAEVEKLKAVRSTRLR